MGKIFLRISIHTHFLLRKITMKEISALSEVADMVSSSYPSTRSTISQEIISFSPSYTDKSYICSISHFLKQVWPHLSASPTLLMTIQRCVENVPVTTITFYNRDRVWSHLCSFFFFQLMDNCFTNFCCILSNLSHIANSNQSSILHMVISMLLFPYISSSPPLSPCP